MLLVMFVLFSALFYYVLIRYDHELNELKGRLHRLESTFDEIVKIINSRTPLGKENLAELIIVNEDIKRISSKIYSGNFTSDLITYTHWVFSSINYTEDSFYPMIFGNVTLIRDFWQSSVETIDMGKGDCEDFAILLASLIRASYEKADVYIVTLSIPGNSEGHAALMAIWNGSAYIADPTLDRVYMLGDSMKSIKRNINRWFSDFGGIDVKVSFIVGKSKDGKNVYMSFSSNLEFINWVSTVALP